MNSRILQEYKDINHYPLSNCGLTIGLFNENDPTKWRVCITGPLDTPYKGGVFYLSVEFPPKYPEVPPEICFLTPIYHVNVNPRKPTSIGQEPLGHVSLSTLNWWKKEYKMREVLSHIFIFFYIGNPDSPYGLERAEEMRNNRELFEKKVKYFTKKYANPMDGLKYCGKDKDWNFNLP